MFARRSLLLSGVRKRSRSRPALSGRCGWNCGRRGGRSGRGAVAVAVASVLRGVYAPRRHVRQSLSILAVSMSLVWWFQLFLARERRRKQNATSDVDIILSDYITLQGTACSAARLSWLSTLGHTFLHRLLALDSVPAPPPSATPPPHHVPPLGHAHRPAALPRQVTLGLAADPRRRRPRHPLPPPPQIFPLGNPPLPLLQLGRPRPRPLLTKSCPLKFPLPAVSRK